MRTLTLDAVRRNIGVLLTLLPILSIAVPILILYFYQNVAFPPYPSYYQPNMNSFEVTWKGRTFYIFFLWLAFLEVVMNWEKLQAHRVKDAWSIRTGVFILALSLPTIYVVVSNFYGLNRALVDWTYAINIRPGCDWVPLSTEHLVLASLFPLAIWLLYGTSGLKNAAISSIFLAIIGLMYTVDNVYPNGSFTPFQVLVPATTTVAASVLNLIGYQTQWSGEFLGTPVLRASNSTGSAAFGIAWPCSGIESLLIFSIVIVLFLKALAVPWRQGVIYFVIGAIVTFFINILRIVTIFVIAINTGGWSTEVEQFHNFFGQLYSMIWITTYPLLIVGSRNLWARIGASRKVEASKTEIHSQAF
jgi:thaumarchaeosortase